MKKTLNILLILSSINLANATDYYNFNYSIIKDEDFPSVLKRFVKPTSIITKSSPTIIKTTQANPQVANWRELSEGTVVSLYISREDFDIEQFESFVLANKEIFNPVLRPKRNLIDYKTSIYYMTSFGSFSQESEGVANIDYNQNSPMTLGLQSAYPIKGTDYVLSGHVFYSDMKTSVESIQNTQIDIPSEYGLNIYMNYAMDKPDITLFAGLDYENFFTFNIDELQTNRAVFLDETKAAFLTLGIKKYFTIYNNELIAKASLSKTISTQSTTDSTITENLDYSGMKFNMNLDYQFSEKFYFKTHFRYQSIEGSSNLNSMKFGFGVGYVLF